MVIVHHVTPQAKITQHVIISLLMEFYPFLGEQPVKPRIKLFSVCRQDKNRTLGSLEINVLLEELEGNNVPSSLG